MNTNWPAALSLSNESSISVNDASVLLAQNLNYEARFLPIRNAPFKLEDMIPCALKRAARSNPSYGR